MNRSTRLSGQDCNTIGTKSHPASRVSESIAAAACYKSCAGCRTSTAMYEVAFANKCAPLRRKPVGLARFSGLHIVYPTSDRTMLILFLPCRPVRSTTASNEATTTTACFVDYDPVPFAVALSTLR